MSSPRLAWTAIVLAALPMFFAPAAHACTAPSTGGVTVCSPVNSANTVNPVHFIAAASSTTCSSGIASISILNSSGSKLYTISGSTLDTFLPIKPSSYTLTVRATDKCGGTQQKNVAVTVRGTAVITYQYNSARTGANLFETKLTPSNVHATTFGKIFSCSVDSYIYGQPLFVPGLSIGGATHNVVFVATENNSIYAFDADGKSCTPLWHDFVDVPVPCTADSPEPGSNCNLVLGTPGVGITSTMFIDPTQGTHGVLYAEARTAPSGVGQFFHGLHKYDLTTGIEMSDSPVTIGATIAGNGCDSVNGVVTFDSVSENDRSALLYANGVIYIGFGSINDVPICPNGAYHGWILGYNAFNIKQQLVVFNDTRNKSTNGSGNGGLGAIWGGALAATSSNWIFAVTGNGPFDPSVGDWSNSYMKLSRGAGTTLNVADYFAPHAIFNNDDKDLGASGGILLDHASPYPHELIGGDKLGTLYVVNRDAMGKFNSTSDQIIQEMPNAVGTRLSTATSCNTSGDDDCDYSTPSYWNGHLYVSGVNDHVKAYALSNGLLSGPTAKAPQTFGYPGSVPSISANGSSNGIVWAVEPAKAVLHAYSASNLATELWNSNQNSTRDALGSNVKFAPVTIANGHVYVGTKNRLVGYGLLSQSTSTLAVTVSAPTNGQTVNNPVAVKASASGPNPISQMQVWVNYKEVYSVSGATINTSLTLPVGSNERFVVQAVDSTGAVAKVVESINVN